MAKGMFVSYQMAEAINLLVNPNNPNELKSLEEILEGINNLIKLYGLEEMKSPEEVKSPEDALNWLKSRWLEVDKIPGYRVNVPPFPGIQDERTEDGHIKKEGFTLDDVKTLAKDIKQVDTYSTENAANMQYCLIKGADGKIDFNFTALTHIAELARANGKKLVIDSAVVFGDRYPENMKGMNSDEVREAIAIYIQKLIQEFGKVIERIDVLNSVFQRSKIDKELKSEEFWKAEDTLGEDYASEVLDIASGIIKNSNYPNIKLGWNEFFLTHQGMPDRQKDFIERIKSLKGKLNVVGVQDNFRANMAPVDIEAQLKIVLNAIKELGMEMSITELSCGVGGEDIRGLGEKGTEGYEGRLSELNDRISKILDMVIDFAKENDITSLETRHSDKYDYHDKHGHEGIRTGLSREQLETLLMKSGKDGMEHSEDVRQKIEGVVINLALNVPNIPKERVQKFIESLMAMKQPKDVIERLAMRLEKMFGNSPQFKDIYIGSLEQLLTIDEKAFESVEDLLNKVEFNKSHNITPGNMCIEENHALIDSTISSLCSKLNELGVDYYLVGALSAFIGTGVPLFRYHGDLDFMIAEKDIDKVREALKDSDYVFEDNRLTTDKTYDPSVGHTQGEHEVIANHKENEFHLGFFLFDRHRDGSIDINEYYKGRKDGKDVPMVLKRHLPRELVELEYTTETTEYVGTTFRTSTPESIYAKKSYTAKGKDLLDIEALEGAIDFGKIEEAKEIRTATRTMRADDRGFNH